MNLKQLILIISIVIGSLLGILLILLAIYKFAPGVLGIKKEEEPEKTEKIEELESEPRIVLSRKQYDQWIQKGFNVEATLAENKFLNNYQKTLLDSIAKLNSQLSAINKELSIYVDSMKKSNQIFATKDKKIQELLTQIAGKDKQITQLQRRIEGEAPGGIAATDSAKDAVLMNFAKIYENSDPKEVAKIFEHLDTKEAAKILRFMSKKKAGKIIDALKPERSAEILQTSFK
jgi:flagellar motility protein MotE (MotC chaperone)